MGRSVSYPPSALALAFNHIDISEEEDEFHWEALCDDFRETCQSFWPSLSHCEKWLDREDFALLENDLCYAGLSCYCGLIAYWIAPKDGERHGLACHWIESIAKRFEGTFGNLRKIGQFSNGEAVFESIV